MPGKVIYSRPVIQILLSTYNGSRYIPEQLDSIIRQTYSNWRLVIRDDDSADNTLELLNQYKQTDNRITVINDAKGNVGAPQSFGLLLQHVNNADYIMFADQDDVWMPEKVEVTLHEMFKAEQQFSSLKPILVHTNFIYVDENLQPVQSKKSYAAVKVKDLNFNHLLAQNPAYGCTMMLNKSLKEFINGIPAAAENHDYWVALTASAFGKIIYLPTATVLYRQHRLNLSGLHDNDSFIKRIKRIITKKNLEDVENKIRLAKIFKEIYRGKLNQRHLQIMNDFILFAKRKSFFLLVRNLKNGLRRQTSVQTLLFYISILLSRKEKV